MAIRFSCPKCASVYDAKDEHAGRTAVCAKCGASIVIPRMAIPIEIAQVEAQSLKDCHEAKFWLDVFGGALVGAGVFTIFEGTFWTNNVLHQITGLLFCIFGAILFLASSMKPSQGTRRHPAYYIGRLFRKDDSPSS